MKKICVFWALCCVLEGSVARANIGAIQFYPAEAGAVTPGAKTVLAVQAARVDLRCFEAGRIPRCAFQASYSIVNPTSAAAGVRAAFRGVRVVDVVVDVGGRSSKGPSFSLSLGPGQAARVVVTGQMRPEKTYYPGYGSDALQTRHPLVGSERQKSEYGFDYLIAPIRSWASFPAAVDLTIRTPKSWSARIFLAKEGPGPPVEPRPTTHADGELKVQRLRVPTRHDRLGFSTTVSESILAHGGPLIGIGGHVDDSGRFRLRAGYEIAAPRWLLWSLNVETDLRDELVIAPVAELATASVLIIPSLGLGAGLPVRLLPDPELGIRLQLSVQWPFVGFVTSFDIYPALATSDPRMFQVGMFARLGL